MINMTLFCIIICLVVAGCCKSIMDTLMFHYEQSIFYKLNYKYGSWLNPQVSWNNKYTWFPNSKILTWLFSNPFVFVTDAWHFFQMILLISISIAISLNTNYSSNFFLKLLIVHSLIIVPFSILWKLFKIK